MILLDYERPSAKPFRLAYALGVIAVALIAGIVAVWCAVQTAVVFVEDQQLIRSQPIDFDVASFGRQYELLIPLGVLCGGIALVAGIHLIRLIKASSWYDRKTNDN